MKKLLIFFSLFSFLFSSWCDVSGFETKNLKNAASARLFNDTKRTYASVCFALLDQSRYGLAKNSLMVKDSLSGEFFNANNAFFVLDTRGDMFGQTQKLAFKTLQDAKNFAQKSAKNAQVLRLNQVLHACQNTALKDAKKLNNLIKKRFLNIGQKAYAKRCQSIAVKDFVDISDLKKEIVSKELCQNLSEKTLQSVALFLWNENKKEFLVEHKPIAVKETEKCPVCGMFVAKYPSWVAQISYETNKGERNFYFDGVKDLMKFYFDPNKWGKFGYLKKEKIKNILVSDYYTQKAIDGQNAFFVIRSDVYGPMGNELVPFEFFEDALEFLKDHKGKKILKFSEIQAELPYELDLNLPN